MKRILTVAIGLLLFAAMGVATADVLVSASEDQIPAIRIKNGYNETLTIKIDGDGSGATNRIVIGNVINLIDGSGATDTIDEWVAAIKACTNSEGKAYLTVDGQCALATNRVDSELLPMTNQISPGEWGTIYFKTSVQLQYGVYIPNSEKAGASPEPKTIRSIFGSIGGTGNITLNIYKDRTPVYREVIVSPVYLMYTNMQNETSSDDVTPGQFFKKDLNIPVGVGENWLIRAERATTATTGNIGAIVTSGKR